MAQSKYLEKSLIILAIVTYTHNTLASAWLLKQSRYKYSATSSWISDKSRYNRRERADLYLQIQQKIFYLYEIIKELKKSSALYNKTFQEIQYLKKIAIELESYQDDRMNTFSIEYGITDRMNLGINACYKKNAFYTKDSHTKSFDIFYKFRLFQNNSYVVTVQPKIIINKDQNHPQELFHEISLLAGHSKKKRSVEFFSETAFSMALCGSKSCDNKKYYSFSISEGVKFPLGFMLVSFTKYYVRQHYGAIYNKTLYEQLSIAKEINWGNMKKKNFTVQLGYFWDRSLKKTNYQISGTIFSIWLDI